MEKTWRRARSLRTAEFNWNGSSSLNKNKNKTKNKNNKNKNENENTNTNIPPYSWPQKEAGVTSLKNRMRAKNKKYMHIKPKSTFFF